MSLSFKNSFTKLGNIFHFYLQGVVRQLEEVSQMNGHCVATKVRLDRAVLCSVCCVTLMVIFQGCSFSTGHFSWL
jgi:hypothetical protein